MRRTLNELTDLSEEKQSRLCETLLLWLSTGSSLVEVAARLKVHPQTVRYRMRRIQEIFGDRLHDLDWRFETELALRYWQLQNRRLHADVH